jgi:PAS domain S-box-containing protein
VSGHLDSSEAFRLAIEAAPTGMVVADDQGRIVLVNAQVERLFGYPNEELIGQPIEMLVPGGLRAHHPALRAAFSGEPSSRPMGGGPELFGRRKDGTEIPVEVGLNPLRTPEGDFVLSSVVDISHRKRGERETERLLGELRGLNAELEQRVEARTAELQASLREREVLLEEIHHRVKNNLQVISSLIGMQARALAQGPGRDALVECQMRVQAIALIHEKLYGSRDYARVSFSEYVRTLAADVFQAAGVSPGGVSLDLAVADVALAVGKAIPCGLILNELITNALKHAFRDGRRGTIHVELAPVAAGLRLVVWDDGVGLPAGFDLASSASLGLQLVRMLARQLDAALDVEGSRGTWVRLTVPVEP